MKRNLTIQLDETVIKKGHIVAARRSTSISRFVSETIEHVAERDTTWASAKKSAMDHLNQTFHLRSGPLPRREELH